MFLEEQKPNDLVERQKNFRSQPKYPDSIRSNNLLCPDRLSTS